MKIKKIKYCHPALRRKAEKVDAGNDLSGLIEEMKRIFKEEDGAGLAAPQVGVSKRVIVINATEDQVVALLNPEIIEKSQEKVVGREGCLSLKGVWLDIERHKEIKVKFLNEEGVQLEIDAKELLAVILQHEIDHLEGKLFIDRVGFLRKVKAIFSYFFLKDERTY